MNLLQLIMAASMMAAASFYKSERRGPLLGYMGHEYITTTKTKKGQSWRCREYKKFLCNATAKTVGEEVDISNSPAHSHEGNANQVLANELKSKILEEAAAGVGATNRNIIGRHFVNVDPDVLALLPKKSGTIFMYMSPLSRHLASNLVTSSDIVIAPSWTISASN